MKVHAIMIALCLCAAAAAQAETIVVDGKVEVAPSDVPRPAAGMTMEAVTRKFGEPSNRHPTVGKPPITRWDYPAFAVFFEGDRVIHAVAIGSGGPADTTPAQAPAPADAAPSAPAPAPAASAPAGG
ncbi:MAG TPA: hypothetical protein VMB48_13435 [Steroidobacteraceae bacterium]|nr:hypothetical protein [Steroidobacteraceae bacterium]